MAATSGIALKKHFYMEGTNRTCSEKMLLQIKATSLNISAIDSFVSNIAGWRPSNLLTLNYLTNSFKTFFFFLKCSISFSFLLDF